MQNLKSLKDISKIELKENENAKSKAYNIAIVPPAVKE